MLSVLAICRGEHLAVCIPQSLVNNEELNRTTRQGVGKLDLCHLTRCSDVPLRKGVDEIAVSFCTPPLYGMRSAPSTSIQSMQSVHYNVTHAQCLILLAFLSRPIETTTYAQHSLYLNPSKLHELCRILRAMRGDGGRKGELRSFGGQVP